MAVARIDGDPVTKSYDIWSIKAADGTEVCYEDDEQRARFEHRFSGEGKLWVRYAYVTDGHEVTDEGDSLEPEDLASTT